MYDHQQLKKLLDGHCTEAEAQAFRQYLASENPDLSLLREVMAASWNEVPDDARPPVLLQQELLAAFRQQLYPGQEARVVAMRRTKRIWYSVAASLLTVGLASWWLLINYRKAPQQVHTAAAIVWKTLENRDARVKHAVLPDSSQVWLHPHSTLSYALQEANQRAIRLEGEAFFDVKHDAQRPFVVYTGEVATRVLGTAFNIEAWQRERSIRVSLLRGKVALEKIAAQQGPPLEVLQPGEMVDYNKTEHQSRRTALKLNDMADWTNGYLVCNDLPVTDALERVAARYGKKLLLGDGVHLSGKRITTVFKNETPEEMLDIILFVSKSRYTMKNDIIEVTPAR